MRQTRVPHLYNRNGTYYFRYRLSKKTAALLNKWEIRRSLGKVSFQQALIINSFLQLSAKILEQRAARMPEGKKLTSEEAEKFIQKYFKEMHHSVVEGLESSTFDSVQETEFQISSWQDHSDIMNGFSKWDNQSGGGSVWTCFFLKQVHF